MVDKSALRSLELLGAVGLNSIANGRNRRAYMGGVVLGVFESTAVGRRGISSQVLIRIKMLFVA